MSIDLDGIDSFSWYSNALFCEYPSDCNSFHNMIVSNNLFGNSRFGKAALLYKNLNELQQITKTSFQNRIKPLKGGQVEIEVKFEWGGDKINISGGAKAEAHDDNGNYGAIEIKVEKDGTGSTTFSGGHREGDDN